MTWRAISGRPCALEALYVKCKTNSREVVEAVSGRTPGAPSYTKLQTMCKAWVDTWESAFKLDADTMLLMLMDNVGRYKTGTARIGDTGTLKSATVTNAAGVLFRDGDNLQRRAALSPSCWEKEWRDVPTTFFELETEPREGEERGEADILKAQRDSYVLQCFAELDATKDPDNVGWSDPIVKAYPRLDQEALAAALAVEEAEAEEAEARVQTQDGVNAVVRDVKVCPGCDVPFYKSKTKCHLCDTALHGIEQYRAEMGGAAAAPQFASFPQPGDPRHYSERESIAEYVDDDGKLRSTTRVGETAEAEASTSAAPQIQTLPFMDLNPSGLANISYIIQKLSTIANLRGAPDVDDVRDAALIREWLIIVRDFGATESLDVQIPNILSLLGPGHEEMAYLRVVSKLVYILCGGDLMDILHFLTENAGLMLASGKCTHKAAQFIEIMRTVIGRSFAREYLLAHPDVQAVPSAAGDLVPFYEWLRDQVHDEAFTLIAEVMVGM